MSQKRIQKAVIPVAGLGTRGLPFTKVVPKELLPVIDTPTIHFIAEEVIRVGIEQIVLVTGRGKASLEEYFDPAPHLVYWLEKRGKEALAEKVRKIGELCEIITVRQKEPLGLGHAIYCARHIVGQEPFVVCLGDEIYPRWGNDERKPALENLVEAFSKVEGSLVGVTKIPKEDSRSYGIVDVDQSPNSHAPVAVKKAVEKPSPESAPSQFAIIGRYVFESDLMDCLGRLSPGVGGEIQLTDGMNELAGKGRLFSLGIDSRRYDIGNHFSYVCAQIEFALERPEISKRLKSYLEQLCGS